MLPTRTVGRSTASLRPPIRGAKFTLGARRSSSFLDDRSSPQKRGQQSGESTEAQLSTYATQVVDPVLAQEP